MLISPARAAGFKVLSADTRLQQDIYMLDAKIDYQLSAEVLDALNNSVPLTIALQIEVRRKRPLLWDETVASWLQHYRLEYHALAQQYVVTQLNNGTVRSFPTRHAATDFIGRIQNFPLIDRRLLPAGSEYYGQIRASLDIESLPAPLRPVAYLSKNWRLTSEWYQWPLS